jgi:hypothetical protein
MNCCKLVRRINKLLPDFVCKLGDGDEVSYTIAKVYRGPEYSAVIAYGKECYRKEVAPFKMVNILLP